MRWLSIGALIVLLILPVRAEESGDAGYLNRGEEYLAAGEHQKALKAFTEAARVKPDSAAAYRGIGLARFRLGANETMTDIAQVEEASTAFTIALRLKPDFAEVLYYLGLAYLVLNNRAGAIQELQALTGLDARLAERLRTSIAGFKPPPAYREVGGSDAGKDTATRVTIIGNQVLVPVTIGYGEQAVQARLLLDTGASVTVISPELAARLGVNPEQTGRSIVQVVGGALIETRTLRLTYLTVGPHTRTGLNIRIVPHAGPPVLFDGLLGMDCLRGLTYRIDFTRSLISWGP